MSFKERGAGNEKPAAALGFVHMPRQPHMRTARLHAASMAHDERCATQEVAKYKYSNRGFASLRRVQKPGCSLKEGGTALSLHARPRTRHHHAGIVPSRPSSDARTSYSTPL